MGITLKELDFHITNRCNMNCIHCLYDSGKRIIEEMELEQIENVISDFAELSEGKGSINLFGGEIFVRKDVFQILDFVKSKGLKLGIITNGNFGTNIFNKIVEYKPDRLTIDLDGASSDTHDWLRNKPGSFIKSVHTIKQFIDKKIPVSITTVLNKKNYKEIEKMLDLCKELNISSISFFIMTPLGRGSQLKEYVLNGIEWIETRKKVLEWVKSNSPKFSIIWENAYKEKREINSRKILCNAFTGEVLNIKCNGDVYFCGLLTATNNSMLGNVKKGGLKEIINNISNNTTNMNGCFALTTDNKDDYVIKGCPYDIQQLNNNMEE